MMPPVPTATKRTGLGLVFALLAGTLALGHAIKAPCAGGQWSDGRQYTRLCYTDIVPLLGTEQLAGGRLPYLDPCNQEAPGSCDEYPVLTMYTMRLAAWASGTSISTFFYANAIVLWLAAFGVAACLYAMVGSRALYFALAPTLPIYATTNWDLIPVALATGATLAYLQRKDVWAGVLLGLGAAAGTWVAMNQMLSQSAGRAEFSRKNSSHPAGPPSANGTFATSQVPAAAQARWIPRSGSRPRILPATNGTTSSAG